jgi:hypothetical protein
MPHGLIQQRLLRFWTLPEQSRPQPFRFMDLPYNIRRGIYLLLDVPTGEFFSLNHVPRAALHTVEWTLSHQYELSAPEDDGLMAFSSENGEEDLDECSGEASNFLHLLLVSKAVYHELRRIIFSENAIGVSQTRFGGLRVLADSGLCAWQDLRVLVIRVQPCGCLTPYCSVEGWPAKDVEENDHEDEIRFFGLGGDAVQRHRRRLSSVNRHDRDMLYQWERICARITAHGQPDRLRLFLACDVEDIDIAKRIVQPLFMLPRLQDIAITFGLPTKNISALRQLARETVLDLLGKLHVKKPFRFLDLPVELQHKILGYTALSFTNTVNVQLDGTRSAPLRPFGISCNYRIESGEVQSKYIDAEKAVFPNAYETRGLFCSLERAAFSSACECSGMPLSWFRVSRRFGDVARTVFYSKTKFRVFGWRERALEPMYPSADADTDRCAPKGFRDFLRYYSHDSLRRMRKITFIFPPMDPTYMTAERKSWALWIETIELLASIASVPSLELTICFASHIYPPEPDGNDWERFKRVGDIEEAEMQAAYRQIITPMKRLSGLKKLFIHVAWPFRDGLAGVRRADEQRLEQSVMGELYDSRKLQKPLDTFWSQPGFIDWWA